MYLGKLTLRLPFMNVYRIYLFYWLIWFHPFIDFKGGEHCFVFTLTPLLMIDKKGEKYFGIYACLKISCLCIYKEKRIWWVSCLIGMFISLYLHPCLFMHVLHCHILLLICYAWVKGELLWSFTLIHAYI